MSKDSLEQIAQHTKCIRQSVKDINHKLTHFLQNYREDYYDALNSKSYQKQLKQYQS